MRLFGLIGYPLGHSFSGRYFSAKFEAEGIEGCRYELFPIASIEALHTELLPNNPDLEGLNVTIPYKQAVIELLDETRYLPKGMESPACNCIKIVSGKLIGFNTDVIGFEQSLRQYLQPSHHSALVLGTGGAAMAVAWVLGRLGIPYRYVSRNRTGERIISYEMLDTDTIASTPLIINTTPLGMYPHSDSSPPIPYEAVGKGHYLYDLVYNAHETLFVTKALGQGAVAKSGKDMLAIQAEASWKIWNTSLDDLG